MYTSILVGTDGSATAARAVDRAVDVARATGAGLTLLTAGRSARAVVEREASRIAGSGVEVTTRVSEVDAATALVDAAQEGGYDLLVVGNKGMVGPRRLLGSVPNKVSHHLPCTLLIVRTT
jgi:nucleotide-binding universal stress UspA family protein